MTACNKTDHFSLAESHSSKCICMVLQRSLRFGYTRIIRCRRINATAAPIDFGSATARAVKGLQSQD